MKKILFITDFSSDSLSIFPYALNLARKTAATITVYHVYEDVAAGKIQYTDMDLSNFINGVDRFPMFENMLCQKAGEVIVHYFLDRGKFVDRLLHHLSTVIDYDLIMMETSGTCPVKEIFVEKHTIQVLEKIDTLLLAIPEQAQFDGNINRLVFLTEYREDEDVQALRRVIGLADLFDAEIHVVHFDTAHTDMITQNLEKFKNALQLDNREKVFFKSINAVDVEKALANYCEKYQIDIISLINHRSNFFQRIFNYNLAVKLIYRSHMPVLTFNVA